LGCTIERTTWSKTADEPYVVKLKAPLSFPKPKFLKK